MATPKKKVQNEPGGLPAETTVEDDLKYMVIFAQELQEAAVNLWEEVPGSDIRGNRKIIERHYKLLLQAVIGFGRKHGTFSGSLDGPMKWGK